MCTICTIFNVNFHIRWFSWKTAGSFNAGRKCWIQNRNFKNRRDVTDAFRTSTICHSECRHRRRSLDFVPPERGRFVAAGPLAAGIHGHFFSSFTIRIPELMCFFANRCAVAVTTLFLFVFGAIKAVCALNLVCAHESCFWPSGSIRDWFVLPSPIRSSPYNSSRARPRAYVFTFRPPVIRSANASAVAYFLVVVCAAFYAATTNAHAWRYRDIPQ